MLWMCYQSYGESVKHRVIQKYFWKAGILDEDFNPLTLVEDDPFAEADVRLQDLIIRVFPESCPLKITLMERTTLKHGRLPFLTPNLNSNIDNEGTHSDGGDGEDQPVTPPKLKIICEVVESLYDIKRRF